jgi:hypothetical protein
LKIKPIRIFQANQAQNPNRISGLGNEISTRASQFSTSYRENAGMPMTDFLVALQALPIHACEQDCHIYKSKNKWLTTIRQKRTQK